MSRQSRNVEVSTSVKVVTVIKAVVMAYVVTAIFVLLSSVVLACADVSTQFENIISLVGIIVSAFLAGYDTAKVEGRNGYKWGLTGGTLYFIVFLVLGTLMGQTSQMATSTLIVIALVVLITSCIAGMISVNLNSETDRRYAERRYR